MGPTQADLPSGTILALMDPQRRVSRTSSQLGGTMTGPAWFTLLKVLRHLSIRCCTASSCRDHTCMYNREACRDRPKHSSFGHEVVDL